MPDEPWDATLASAGLHIQRLDAALTDAEWASLAEAEAPAPVRLFAELWARGEMDQWRALVESAASVNPEVRGELADEEALAPLRALLAGADHAAIIFDAASRWKAPSRWGYLLMVRPLSPAGRSAPLILHPPAPAGELRQAEHVLAMRLPPSYKRFLMLTNGLAFDARERVGICGAGPQRANWDAVMLNLWMECGGQNEVAARWREFQGTYAYERIMDRERGEDTFLSDETALIPFAHTYDDWCFDRTRPDVGGDYPIMLWDHEAREATDRFRNFASWFAGEVETYIWPG